MSSYSTADSYVESFNIKGTTIYPYPSPSPSTSPSPSPSPKIYWHWEDQTQVQYTVGGQLKSKTGTSAWTIAYIDHLDTDQSWYDQYNDDNYYSELFDIDVNWGLNYDISGNAQSYSANFSYYDAHNAKSFRQSLQLTFDPLTGSLLRYAASPDVYLGGSGSYYSGEHILGGTVGGNFSKDIYSYDAVTHKLLQETYIFDFVDSSTFWTLIGVVTNGHADSYRLYNSTSATDMEHPDQTGGTYIYEFSDASAWVRQLINPSPIYDLYYQYQNRFPYMEQKTKGTKQFSPLPQERLTVEIGQAIINDLKQQEGSDYYTPQDPYKGGYND